MRADVLAAAGVSTIVGALLAMACSPPAAPVPSYTLHATLAQGLNLSGPYAATLTGPGGFSCSMSQLQQSVTCAPASFAAGTAVQLTVTVTIPGFANADPILSTSGCDSVTINSCTVLMNANRSVTIRAGKL